MKAADLARAFDVTDRLIVVGGRAAIGGRGGAPKTMTGFDLAEAIRHEQARIDAAQAVLASLTAILDGEPMKGDSDGSR